MVFYINNSLRSESRELFSEDAGHNVNRLQFLRQQLVCVRNFHFGEIRGVATGSAQMNAHVTLGKFRLFHRWVVVTSNHTAFATDMGRIFVRYIVQPFPTESRHTVGNHHVTFHLPNAEPTIT